MKRFCTPAYSAVKPTIPILLCPYMVTAQSQTLTLLDRKQKDVNEGHSCYSKNLSYGKRHHRRIKKIRGQVFSPLSSHVPLCWLLSEHTHTLLWMNAFYGSRHRDIHFYFTWLLLPAGQLSCYCHCYIGGTNGSDSVFAKPHTFEYNAVMYRFIWLCCRTACVLSSK